MPGFHWLTIGHVDANKGHGVRIVKEMVGADRVVCFGDNLNDLAMFEVADEAYAMAEAHDGLRDIAHGTIRVECGPRGRCVSPGRLARHGLAGFSLVLPVSRLV